MEKILIKCPNCGKKLQVNLKKNSPDISIQCQACGMVYPLSAYKLIENEVKKPNLSCDTVFDNPSSSVAEIGYLIDEQSKQKYFLKEGLNLIGRMTRQSPPKASVPIDTDDMGVSRAHFYIEVKMCCDHQYHYYIFNAENKNPTLVNNVQLTGDEQLGLKNNDVISFSKTRLLFKSGDYATELNI